MLQEGSQRQVRQLSILRQLQIMIRVKLLGAAAVHSGEDGSRGLTRRHPLALLALLATAPELMLSRGKLVGLLWPDVPESTARNRLTSCVYEVRSAVGADVLQSAGDDLRFNETMLPCDVCRFTESLAAGDHATAVELYSGPFLDGFQMDGSAEFEQRVDRERDRLRWSYQGALETLARRASEKGGHDEAIAWWRLRTADDPYDSRVAGELITALAATANRAEALRVARSHTQLLLDEFGAEPAADFRRIVDQLRAAPAGSTSAGAGDGAATPPARSIAVLPFESLSGSADAAVFAAGLHEDLIMELSRFSAMTVISRRSVERYHDSQLPLHEIAAQLGVASILQGTVQTAGSRVRLGLRLTDAVTGASRWIERYDRTLSPDNIFEIQGELAVRVAGTLKAELTPAERGGAGQGATSDMEAFRLYAQGRVLLDQRTGHDMTRAMHYFERAIERDPNYALAWAGIADALALLEFYDHPHPPGSPDALHAATRAVELGPALGQVHASLGILQSVRRQGGTALTHLRTAVDLAPGYAEAHAWLGWLHLIRGDPAAALQPACRAVELDPLAPAFRVYLAETWLANGEPDRALTEAIRARELNPQYGLGHFVEGLCHYHACDMTAAAGALHQAGLLVSSRGTPARAEVEAVLTLVRIEAGDDGAAAAALEVAQDEHPFQAGLIHAALGRADDAFDLFSRVADWGAVSIEHFRYFFPDVLGPLRSDARYRALIAEIDRDWRLQAAR